LDQITGIAGADVIHGSVRKRFLIKSKSEPSSLTVVFYSSPAEALPVGAGDRETDRAPACIAKAARHVADPHFSPFQVAKRMDDQHLKVARDSIAASLRVLKDNPKPDTFAGRKTQEALPNIDKA
jgi:hypothetical protein